MQNDRQTGRQAGRQTDRQTNRQTDTSAPLYGAVLQLECFSCAAVQLNGRGCSLSMTVIIQPLLEVMQFQAHLMQNTGAVMGFSYSAVHRADQRGKIRLM